MVDNLFRAFLRVQKIGKEIGSLGGQFLLFLRYVSTSQGLGFVILDSYLLITILVSDVIMPKEAKLVWRIQYVVFFFGFFLVNS